MEYKHLPQQSKISPALRTTHIIKPTLLALTIASVLTGAIGSSLLVPISAYAAEPTATSTQQNVSIPPGKLSDVLAQFAATVGVPLSFEPKMLRDIRSNGLQGSYTAEEGFSALFANTGYELVDKGNGAYSVRKIGGNDVLMMSPVRIGAKAESLDAGTAADAYRVKTANIGVLGNTDLQNTPYSVEVYSREYMDNLQARSLSDLTKYDASISLMPSDMIHENNSTIIRGIYLDFNTGQKLDGLNLRSRASDLPLEHIERTEVLKGASGFLYGFGEPGGTLNYVLKRPTEEFTGSIDTLVMDSGLLLLHGDVSGRFGSQDRFGYRVNAVQQSGDTYINNGDLKRSSNSVALDWRITPDLIWQVDALQAQRKSYGSYWGLVPNTDGTANNWTIGEPLAPIDGSKRLAPSWARYESEHKTYGTDLIWQFHHDWDVKLSHRYSSNYRYNFAAVVFASVDGSYSETIRNFSNFFESNQTQGVITGKLSTGMIKHDLTAGLSQTKTINFNNIGSTNNTRHTFANLGNIYDPVTDPVEFTDLNIAYLDKSDSKLREYSNVQRREVFLSDTLHIGNDWDVIIGARHGTIDSEYADYKESAITPTLAVIYRPVEWMSIYASYVEAFQEGATAPETAANAGEVFDPLISKQYETGIKIDQTDWSANIALFQLKQGLTYTDGNNVFSQDGEADYQGLEISGKANIGTNWLLGASATWLDASNEKTTDVSLEGKNITGVAREQVRLYGEYHVPDSAWALTGGAQYTGKRPTDAANQWYVDSVTLFNLGARYQLNVKDHPITLRLNIENLTDEAYWLTDGSYLKQGAPLTVKLGVQFEF